MKYSYLLLHLWTIKSPISGRFISDKVTVSRILKMSEDLPLLSQIKGEKFIKNIDIPSCRNCVYYRPNYFSEPLSRCDKFGEKNIITDEISYDFADICRDNESKCGKEAKYFEEEPNPNMKIWFYKFTQYFPYTLPTLTIIMIVLLSK